VPLPGAQTPNPILNNLNNLVFSTLALEFLPSFFIQPLQLLIHVMTTLFVQHSHSIPELPELHPSKYQLKWRQQHLLVYPVTSPISVEFSATIACVRPSEDTQWLVERLRRSPTQRVLLSAALSQTDLELWANAATSVGKTVYLQVPNTPELPMKKKWFLWWVKRLIDWNLAALSLILLSPLMVVLALLIKWESPGPVFFQQWRTGERGRLFRIFKFRTMVADAEQMHHQVMGDQTGLHKREDDPRITPIGAWMRKYSLDEIPQLLNVLRGDMSLVGPRPWALYDALRIPREMQQRLSALPGVTGMWQVSARSSVRDLHSVSVQDLSYLRHWSIWTDLDILLKTIPRVLTGFGAY
jgi:lipopolysaccharide/colanic/teichoic acid biosynthesis glycosyltransferase